MHRPITARKRPAAISLLAGCLVCVCSFAAIGAEVDISGLIVDTAGDPVAGATVFLTALKMADTTGADGRFQITTTLSDAQHPAARSVKRFQAPVMENGLVKFSVLANAAVSLTVHDVQGRAVRRIADQILPAGDYAMSPVNRSAGPLPMSVYVAVLRVDGKRYVFKINSQDLKRTSSLQSVQPDRTGIVASPSLHRSAAAVIDTLVAEMINNVTQKQSERIVLPLIGYIGETDDLVFFQDADQDGLTDYRENHVFGTSMMLLDTDGDGWDDAYEAEMFDVQVPESFNPLVADIPVVEVVIVNPPTVHFNYKESSETAQEMAIVQASTITANTSWKCTNSETFAHDLGWSVESKVGASATIKGPVLSLAGGVGHKGTASHQYGVEINSSQATTNEQKYSEALSVVNTKGIELSGGTITLAAKLTNPSNIAFTLDNITLTAFYLDRSSAGYLNTIASNLYCPSATSIVIPGNGTTQEFVFENPNLNLDEVKGLMTRADRFFTDIAGYALSMTSYQGVEGDFVGSATTVFAQTARVSVDFGPYENMPTRTWNVATLCRYDKFEQTTRPVTLHDMLAFTHIDFATTDSGGGSVVSIDGISNSNATRSAWFVTVLHDGAVRGYPASDTQFNLADVTVTKGDFVNFIFSRDRDGDGVSERVEYMLGSLDTDTDSDNDGMPDSSEVYGFARGGVSYTTDPSRADTDGDGIDDLDDPNPLTRARVSGTRIVSLSVQAIDTTVTCVMTEGPFSMYCAVSAEVNGDSAGLIVTTAQIVGDVAVVNNRLPADTLHFARLQRADELTDTLRVPVVPGINTFEVMVTSDDAATHETYSVNSVNALLPQVADWSATAIGGASSTSYEVTLNALEAVNANVQYILIGHVVGSNAFGQSSRHTELGNKVFAGDTVGIGSQRVRVDSVLSITNGAIATATNCVIAGLPVEGFRDIVAIPFGKVPGTASQYLYRNPDTTMRIGEAVRFDLRVTLEKIEVDMAQDDESFLSELFNKDLEMSSHVKVMPTNTANGCYNKALITSTVDYPARKIAARASGGASTVYNYGHYVEYADLLSQWFTIQFWFLEFDGLAQGQMNYKTLGDGYLSFNTFLSYGGTGGTSIVDGASTSPNSSGYYERRCTYSVNSNEAAFDYTIKFEWKYSD